MANVMAQIAFDSKRMQILSQGCDFFNNTYQAEVSCLTGHLLVDHEDYVHKSKNRVSQLRAQCGDDAALSKSADSQNVPIVEAFFKSMANIEDHMQSMKNHPSAARLFVERAASTDDLETESSLVPMGTHPQMGMRMSTRAVAMVIMVEVEAYGHAPPDGHVDEHQGSGDGRYGVKVEAYGYAPPDGHRMSTRAVAMAAMVSKLRVPLLAL
eukprot:gene12417-15613_t